MPSPKVSSAAMGRGIASTRPAKPRSAVRFSTAPVDADQARLQEDIRQSVSQSVPAPFRNGVLKTGFLDTNGGEIEHGLGGAAAGFILCGLRVRTSPPAAIPSVWEVAGTADRANTHIRLFASEPCDIAVWIYR